MKISATFCCERAKQSGQKPEMKKFTLKKLLTME